MKNKKEIPHDSTRLCSPESEQALLSALMLDETGETWALAAALGVRAGAFHLPANRQVWEAIAALVARGSPCSMDVVAEQMRVTGALDAVGGLPFLVECSRAIVTTLQARAHAEQLVLLWQLRHTMVLAEGLKIAVREFSTREEFAAKAADTGQRLIRFGHAAPAQSVAERVAGARDDVLARAGGREDRSGWVRTGLPKVDRMPLGCGDEDHYIILGGGSSHGKSTLMRQWAGQALLDGKRCLFYTRETSVRGFVKKLAASWAGLNLMAVAGAPRDMLEDFARKCDWLENEVADRRLWVVQHEAGTPLLAIEDLAAHYHAFSHLHGHPHLVCVDYAQLFFVNKRCNSREQEVAAISHTLQSLCREAGNVWVAGAQYNESGLREQRALRRDEKGQIIHRIPGAGDLRESQTLYHDADRCYMIYRPPESATGADQTVLGLTLPEQWLCLIKRREGGTGIVKCIMQAALGRFVELRQEECAAPGQGGGGGGISKGEFMRRQNEK
jgi:replicative DNA helicase